MVFFAFFHLNLSLFQLLCSSLFTAAAAAFCFSIYRLLAIWIIFSFLLWRIFSRSEDDLEKRLPNAIVSSLKIIFKYYDLLKLNFFKCFLFIKLNYSLLKEFIIYHSRFYVICVKFVPIPRSAWFRDGQQ